MSNTFTKGYADGAALTEAELDTAYQTLQLDIANTPLMTTGSTSGQALISNGSAVAASFQTIPDPQGPFALRNYGLKATAASGVLTISLKTNAGANPSGADAVNFNYSTNGTTSATYTSVSVTAATSIPINASATLGYTATSTVRVFAYGYYNTAASAVKLAVSLRSDFDNGGSVAMTAISASADDKMVLYATGTLTVIPRLLGWVEVAHNSGYSWQTPTKVNITNQVAGQRGIVISSASGSYSNAGGSYADVTNLTCTITTTGRPVRIELLPDPVQSAASAAGYVGVTKTSGTSGTAKFQILRGSTPIGTHTMFVSGASGNLGNFVPVSSISATDFVAAGTYTYKLQADSAFATTAQVKDAILAVREL